VVLAAAIVGKVLGADDFRTYPTIQIGLGPATLVVCAVVLASGLAPWRRGDLRRVPVSRSLWRPGRHKEQRRVHV
jgi:hypothetical protein